MVAIIVVKQMFGGIGCNFANPAITPRIVLVVSFPAAMTSFISPVDAVTTATPLMGATSFVPTVKQLFFGMHSGCIGETSAFLLLVGGIYLLIRRVISPIIPVCFVGIVALLTLVSGGSVAISVFGGGIMLGLGIIVTGLVSLFFLTYIGKFYTENKMTVKEVICNADELRPNALEEEIKYGWVWTLDGDVANLMKREHQKNPFPQDTEM
jgi:Na+-translocating ferredoxin:NAD+ oxidoreductase RnfD subunit